MKTFVTVLFTGAMLAYTAAAADPGAEERFRMKYGRSTPAEEARLKAVEHQAAGCKRGCCLRPAANATMPPTAAVNDGGAEARFQAKWGRNIPSRDVALTVTASGSNLPAGNGAAERFRLKFGRSMPANAASGGTGPVLAAGAAHPTACEQPCCKQAD